MRLRVCRYSCLVLAGLFVAGCRTPPAQPAGCAGRESARTALLVKQVTADTAAAVADHPGRAAYTFATDTAAYAVSAARGAIEKRVALRFLAPPAPLDPNRPAVNPDTPGRAFGRAAGAPAPLPADVRLYADGSEALAAVDRVIDSATRRLDVMMYLWGDDPVGWHVAERLAARACSRVRVRVLVDGGGNLAQGEPKRASPPRVNRAVCWLARQPGVQLVRTRDPLGRFDHRKLVVADGQVAWSGGRNFVAGAFETYHDLSYTVSGPLASEMADLFERFWRRMGGPPGDAQPAAAPPAAPNAVGRLVRTSATNHSLASSVYEAIGQARHHVYVENPYLADARLVYLLAEARARGADVRVVLTVQSDSKLYDRSNRVTANRLLRAGARVYLYPGMTHAKTLAVDGTWAYLGTGNFDNLSLRHNRELGLTLSDGPAVRDLERCLFEPDFDSRYELAAPLPVTPLDYLAELAAEIAG